jgi:hypothetical protein
MWVERGSPGDGVWRGSVHDVASGNKLYVTGAAEIADFIAGRLSEEDAGEPR